MNLTGKELVERAIIFQLGTYAVPEENIQQHGVDLNLVGVRRVLGGGIIPAEGKTVLSQYEDVKPKLLESDSDTKPKYRWVLEPGVYDITLAQGCDIPKNQRLKLIQRSSLLRNGTMIVSSLFDAGFKTDNIGTVMHVRVPIQIEVGARICQAYTDNSNEVENLYEGQWQGDAQRTDGREEVKNAN